VTAAGVTRDRIIRAATGLFRRRGVTRAGIGDICARAGVTKGVFAHHFPGGKEELVVEAVARNRSDVEAALSTVAPDAPIAEVIAWTFNSYADALAAKGSDFGCPVAASVVDASQASAAVRAAARDAFATWAARLDRDGDGTRGVLAVAALEGAILLARAEDDPRVIERIGRALAALISADTGAPERVGRQSSALTTQ
jgi:TetR/AcrR family transcriptional repressor of lmrAB and yxaGH operons